MNIHDEILAYIPFNKREEKDKQLFLKFIKNNNDILTRNNEEGHITSSCWILNKEHNKVLMCYHNIYDSFSWLGGHNDGDSDCLKVALKELKEESGLNNVKLIDDNIFSIEVLTVPSHIKNGKKIKQHIHYNVTYLFECDEYEPLVIKKDENKALKWFYFDEIKDNVKEIDMYNNVYAKLLSKSKKYL